MRFIQLAMVKAWLDLGKEQVLGYNENFVKARNIGNIVAWVKMTTTLGYFGGYGMDDHGHGLKKCCLTSPNLFPSF